MVAALVVGLAAGGNAALSSVFGSRPGYGRDMALLFLLMICTPGLALAGFVGVMAAALVLRLRATMAANQGRPFQYPFVKKT
jgi:hypothetical protein